MPRIYFAGDSADNDATQDLLDLLERNCVDPDLRDERWGLVVINKSGDSLEAAAAYRLFRAEAVRYYGSDNRQLTAIHRAGDRPRPAARFATCCSPRDSRTPTF